MEKIKQLQFPLRNKKIVKIVQKQNLLQRKIRLCFENKTYIAKKRWQIIPSLLYITRQMTKSDDYTGLSSILYSRQSFPYRARCR